MINNTLKHAKAENISLIIKLDTEGISIEFKDDGVGFIVIEKLESNTIGLNSIHSRVNFLNGTIKIESIPSKGIKYNILIPFSFKQNRK